MKDKNVLELAGKIEEAPIEECGPSDDPDKQYAYTCAFRDIAIRFISAIKRESDHELSELVSNLDTNISDDIRDAHKLKAELLPVIDALRSKFDDPEYERKAIQNSAFLDSKVLSQLKGSTTKQFDLAKLVKMCEELNDCYGRGNYISSILLLRVT
jgi:hypothetical protein